MSTKEIVADLLEHLPDDVSLQDVAYEMDFIASVDEGFDSYERDGGVSFGSRQGTGTFMGKGDGKVNLAKSTS